MGSSGRTVFAQRRSPYRPTPGLWAATLGSRPEGQNCVWVSTALAVYVTGFRFPKLHSGVRVAGQPPRGRNRMWLGVGRGDGPANSAPRPVPATAGALGADGPWPGASSSPGPIPAGGGDSPLRLYEWPVGVVGPRAWEEQIPLGLPRTWRSFRVKTLRTWASLLIVTFTINLKCSLFLFFMSATHCVAQLCRAAHLRVRGWEHGRPGQRPGGDTGPRQSRAAQRGPREGGAAEQVQRGTQTSCTPRQTSLSASHVPLSLFQPAL